MWLFGTRTAYNIIHADGLDIWYFLTKGLLFSLSITTNLFVGKSEWILIRTPINLFPSFEISFERNKKQKRKYAKGI